VLVTAAVVAVGMRLIDTDPPPKLCHSATEDSVILDCDWRGGAWHPYPEGTP
jgi:hypothetical protein